MLGHPLIVAGPARSGKTGKLLGFYRTALAKGIPGRSAAGDVPGQVAGIGQTLWMAPTARAAAFVRESLLSPGFAACFQPNVYTFEAFAQAILDHAPDVVRPLYGMARRQLIARLADDLRRSGKLAYFAAIADTPGFVDLLSGFLSEMKRHEIWPEAFRDACQRRGITQKDMELFEFYEAYQAVLNKRQLFDAEGRFWTARTLLQEGHRRPFERLRLVVVDGFADFTATQHDILAILAEHADDFVVSLPLERDTESRGDLFAKPRATLEVLSRRLPKVRVEWADRTNDSNWPAMDRLERHLLGDPREKLPVFEVSAAETKIEIIAAAQQLGEIQAIAARIKQLLLDGDTVPSPAGGEKAMSHVAVRPQDVVVVFRSTDSIAPLVAEVFTEYGLPHVIDRRPTLGESPRIKALVALLELHDEDWPFRAVLAVLGNNFVAPPEFAGNIFDVHAAAEHVVRALQIPSGRAKLLERWRRLAQQSVDVPELGSDSAATELDDERSHARRRAARQRAAAASLAFVEIVAAALAKLPEKATPVVWAAELDELSQTLGMNATPTPTTQGSATGDLQLDAPASRRLVDVLRAGSRLSEWLEEPEERWSRRELLTALAEIVAAETIPIKSDETGCIRVLSAPAARGLFVPYLFVASLSEHEFPSRARDEVLYHEADRRRLAEQGLRLPQRSERASEEMLLFYEIVTRATRRLVLSYPAMNEKAEPLLASPYLLDVERILPQLAQSRASVADLRPIPRATAGYSPADRRVLAMYEALAGQSDRLAELVVLGAAGSSSTSVAIESRSESRTDGQATRGTRVLADVGANLIAALRTNAARKGERFGPMEGMLTSVEAKALLAKRYGGDRVWSASHFEAYAHCPMRYFFEHVLHLESPEEIELASDSRQRGRLLHAALARAHRGINVSCGGPASPTEFEQEFRQGYLEQLAALAEQMRRDTALDDALLDIDAKLLAELIDQYVEQHRGYDQLDASLRPAHFEVSFGLQVEENAFTDSLSTDAPLVLREGNEEIRIGGRIDRIDVSADENDASPRFGIVDYKTGNPIKKKARAEQADDGRRLQLDLYAIAVEQVLLADRQAVGLQSGYWHVSANGFDVWQAMHEGEAGAWQPTDSWTARRKRLVELVFSLARGIRDGQFPVYSPDDECTKFCDFSTMCRVRQARSLEKTWQPPARK